MQIVPLVENLQEMSNPIFWGKVTKIFQMLSAENFTRQALC